MSTPQPPHLPSITTDDLLKMIGEQAVTIARQAALITNQAALITSQAARLTEVDDAPASRATTTAFDTSAA